MGLFDGKAPFDINGDGKMSASEKAARDSYYVQMLSEMGNEKSEGYNEKQEFIQIEKSPRKVMTSTAV